MNKSRSNNPEGKPVGIAFQKNGNILVSEFSQPHVQVFDPTGKYLTSIDQKFSPIYDIAVDLDDNILIAESGGSRLVVIDGKTYQKLKTYPTEGTLAYPTGVRVAPNTGNIIVTEHGSSSVKILDPHGKILKTITKGFEGSRFMSPHSSAVDGLGNIITVDHGNCRIQIFDSKGKFLKGFGSRGTGLHELKDPACVAIDPDGNIWISDYGSSRICVWG